MSKPCSKDLTSLDDSSFKQYIRDGYVHLRPTMPDGFHQNLYQQVDEVFENEGNPGNNLLPRIPMIQKILDHPQIHGALTSILGADYLLHAHRHCHYRGPLTDGQQMHKDSWARRHHRTRWAMAFYYPQDTTTEMGPTGVVPGSQYLNAAQSTEGEVALAGEAGTVTIVHYDLWHRGMANTTDRKRYMFKFLFARMEAPESADGTEANGFDESDPRSSMWRSMMSWHRGRTVSNTTLTTDEAARLARHLSGSEPDALHSAYTLGTGGSAGHDILLDALRTHGDTLDAEPLLRNIGYGLSAAGEAVSDELCKTVSGSRAIPLRLAAIDALADTGVGGDLAADTLRGLLSDGEVEIRRRAAYGLSCLGNAGSRALPDLVAALQSDDEWLTRNASFAIACHARSAAEFVPQLRDSATHPNRYVQANALKSLERINTPQSASALLEILEVSRWCPITTPKTPY